MSQENEDSIEQDLPSQANGDNNEANGTNSSIVDLDAVSCPEGNTKEIVDLTKEIAAFIDLTEDDGPVETFQGSSAKHRRKRKKRNRPYKNKRNQNDSTEIVPGPSAPSQSIDSSFQTVSKRIVCPICMDDSDHIIQDKRHLVSTTCGHIFCNRCLEESIKVHHKCPTCRKNVNNKKYHKLFL